MRWVSLTGLILVLTGLVWSSLNSFSKAAKDSCEEVCQGEQDCAKSCQCTVQNCYLECSKEHPALECSMCSKKACQSEISHLTKALN